MTDRIAVLREIIAGIDVEKYPDWPNAGGARDIKILLGRIDKLQEVREAAQTALASSTSDGKWYTQIRKDSADALEQSIAAARETEGGGG